MTVAPKPDLLQPLQHPGVDFPREADECDPTIVGTHPSVHLFSLVEPTPQLSVQRHRPQLPHNAAEVCQLKQPQKIQHLDCIHPPVPSLRPTSVISAWMIIESTSEVLSLRFIYRRCNNGIEEILEVLLPPPENIPIQGQQLYTMLVEYCLILLRQQKVCQPIVHLSGLTLVPDQSFCFHDRLNCQMCASPLISNTVISDKSALHRFVWRPSWILTENVYRPFLWWWSNKWFPTGFKRTLEKWIRAQ